MKKAKEQERKVARVIDTAMNAGAGWGQKRGKTLQLVHDNLLMLPPDVRPERREVALDLFKPYEPEKVCGRGCACVCAAVGYMCDYGGVVGEAYVLRSDPC